jgi:hypothetical protein
MLCQIILPQVALADPDINLTGQDDYLVVHNASGTYPVTGGPSVISVTKSDNSAILPSGNTYSNVPAGAKLKITYVFHLEDGDDEGTTEYEYKDGSFFTLPLNYQRESLLITQWVHSLKFMRLIQQIQIIR